MFQYFYHQTLRKTVATFGTIFNNIKVIRADANGKVLNQTKVPLAYAPRSKFLERIRTTDNLETDTKVALKLPRMSFEITSISYDAERKLPKMNNYYRYTDSTTNKNKFLAPVPYLISFQLNVYSKTQDDALQIVEQIIPYFAPQYSITVKPFTEFTDIKHDIPITLQSVTFSDDFEGSQETRRTIIYTLDFQMNTFFYGPVYNQGFIREAITDIGILGDTITDSDGKIARITVTPSPENVTPPNDFGFNEDIEYFNE